MWTITDAKGNERGRFDTEADAWKEYDRLSDLAGCLAPYSVKFNNSISYCRATGGSDRRCDLTSTRYGAEGIGMGTDIHGVFQRHDGTAWVDIPSKYDEGRHYQLFAVLAGVRNGTGFAGVRTGDAVTPISEPRGLPDDFKVGDGDTHPIQSLEIMSERRRKYHENDDPREVWMGDHSHSWLTAAEMLEWYERAPSVVQTGIISSKEYDAWDKQSRPDSYCGGISGPGVLVIEQSEVGSTSKPWTHVRVTWETGLKDELKYFFDEVRRLHEEHGEIRYVFGFDS